MPRHRGHKNARNTEYAQRAAFDLRIRAEENTPPNQIQRMTPHQLPRTAKSAEFIEFTGPIKSPTINPSRCATGWPSTAWTRSWC